MRPRWRTALSAAPSPAAKPAPGAPARPLLSIDGLKTHFRNRDGIVRAVDGVSFDVHPGETLAVVGESGCGKSVTLLSVLRLLPMPPARIVAGRVLFDGRDLLKVSDKEMRDVRGNAISMIFQEPMTSLNPVLTVGQQIAETLVLHRGLSPRDAMARAVDALAKVRISEPERRVKQYPHELSGGMRQRVMIAMALACGPRLLIADEPTTALDVTIQAQILELMRALSAETGASIVLITHDLGVVAEMAQRVVVMYAGRKVEEAPVGELFARPLHPYTRGLLGSMPHLGGSMSGDGRTRLTEIPGVVPSLKEELPGCLFAPRCPYAGERCRREVPPLEAHGPGHYRRVLGVGVPARVRAAGRGRTARPEREAMSPTATTVPIAASPPRERGDLLLEVRNLRKHFPTRHGLFGGKAAHVHAVDDVSFRIGAGETLGLVGESGCGKSTTGKLILRAAAADGRRDPVARQAHRGLQPDRDAADPPRAAGGVPGPVLVAESADARGRHRRRAAAQLRVAGGRSPPASAPPSSSPASACAPTS